MSRPHKVGNQEKNWNRWLLVLTLVALALIWGQSVLPVSQSVRESGWLLKTLVNPALRFLGLPEMRHTLLRKLAHVSEFAFFTFCLSQIFRGSLVHALAFGFLAAVLDESIQIFSKRGARVSDIWIDFIGVAIGALLGKLFWHILRRRDAKRQGKQATE